MTELIAYCGLNCADCGAYQATISNDENLREEVAKKWAAEYNAPNLTSKDIYCTGCTTAAGPWFSHCQECTYRLCAKEKGVETCAACADFPCPDIEGFLNRIPVARQNLEKLRGE